jgi:outer membrane protein TolC
MKMNKNRLMTGLIGILMMLSVKAALAETLEDAWANALNNNHQLKSAKADTRVSEQQLHSAEGQRLPDLNVSSGYTQYSETPAAKTQIAGQSTMFSTAQAGGVKAQALASVPIFTSGRIRHNIDAAEASLQAVQSNEVTSTLDIKMQVAESYINVLRLESTVQVAQSHVDSLDAHNKDVNNLFNQGIVARVDILAANVELVNAQQQVVQASNQLDIAQARYNQVLDRHLTDGVNLSRQFPEIPQGSLSELSGTALKHRPELSSMAQQIEALGQQAQSVKAGLLPQVAVNGGYQYQENRYQAFEGMWMANVGVEWKIFDGSSGHRSDAMTGQAISLKEQRDNLSSIISLQVRQAWLDIQETQKRTQVTQQAIAQADENLKVTIDRYQQGLSTNTEVLKAEDLRTVTRSNLNNAQYDAALAALHLRRAVGVL